MFFFSVSEVTLQSVKAAWEYVEEDRFDSSTRMDENTGEVWDPWAPELDVEAKASDLPLVKPGKPSPVKKSWRMLCSGFDVGDCFGRFDLRTYGSWKVGILVVVDKLSNQN